MQPYSSYFNVFINVFINYNQVPIISTDNEKVFANSYLVIISYLIHTKKKQKKTTMSYETFNVK